MSHSQQTPCACGMCGTGDTAEQYVAKIRAVIARHGHAIQAVIGHNPGLAYTVGMTAQGLPELVIAGQPVNTAALALRQAVAAHTGAAHLIPGHRLSINGDDYEVRPVDALTVATFLPVIKAVYGMFASALQLVWADPSGRFPGQPGCETPVLLQTISSGRS